MFYIEEKDNVFNKIKKVVASYVLCSAPQLLDQKSNDWGELHYLAYQLLFTII
ncbi:hypothetical protein TVTCOM_05630 [Terrisporobacter vanillatitrophus]